MVEIPRRLGQVGDLTVFLGREIELALPVFGKGPSTGKKSMNMPIYLDIANLFSTKQALRFTGLEKFRG